MAMSDIYPIPPLLKPYAFDIDMICQMYIQAAMGKRKLTNQQLRICQHVFSLAYRTGRDTNRDTKKEPDAKKPHMTGIRLDDDDEGPKPIDMDEFNREMAELQKD
jgi:hypothetical protein